MGDAHHFVKVFCWTLTHCCSSGAMVGKVHGGYGLVVGWKEVYAVGMWTRSLLGGVVLRCCCCLVGCGSRPQQMGRCGTRAARGRGGPPAVPVVTMPLARSPLRHRYPARVSAIGLPLSQARNPRERKISRFGHCNIVSIAAHMTAA